MGFSPMKHFRKMDVSKMFFENSKIMDDVQNNSSVCGNEMSGQV